MEQANKDRSLVSKVMDGLVTGIVEEEIRRDTAAAGRAVERVRREPHGDARSALDACSRATCSTCVRRSARAIRPMSDWRMIDEDVVNWRFRAKPDPVFLRDVIEFRILIEPRASAQASRVARQRGRHRGGARRVRGVQGDPSGRARLSGSRRTVPYAHRRRERQSVLQADGGDHSAARCRPAIPSSPLAKARGKRR